MNKFVSNSFQIPNAFVDEMLNKVSGNACKIYLLIVRKTRGWHKEADRISYSQIQKSTGIGSSATVDKAISELVDFGLISYKKGNEKSANEYRLNDAFCTSKNEVGGTSKNEVQKNCSTSKIKVATSKNEVGGTSKNEVQKNCSTSKIKVATSKNEVGGTSKNEDTEIHIFKNTYTKDKSEYDTHTHESQTFENSQNPISQQTQSVDNGILEKSKSKTTKPKTTYEPPIDLKPTEKQIEDCNKLGVNVNLEFEKFLNWALAKGQGYVDWSRAFSTWISNINNFGNRQNTQSFGKNNEPSFFEQLAELDKQERMGFGNPNFNPHSPITDADFMEYQ